MFISAKFGVKLENFVKWLIAYYIHSIFHRQNEWKSRCYLISQANKKNRSEGGGRAGVVNEFKSVAWVETKWLLQFGFELHLTNGT